MQTAIATWARGCIMERRQTLDERRIFEMFDRALEAQRRSATNADLRLICDALMLRMIRSV